MDDRLLPRPDGTYTVKCPSCKHAINQHFTADAPFPGCISGMTMDRSGCPCSWTPNDIAWSLLYSGLTKMASPTPVINTNWIKRSLPW